MESAQPVSCWCEIIHGRRHVADGCPTHDSDTSVRPQEAPGGHENLCSTDGWGNSLGRLSELQSLIAEQEKDDRTGHRVYGISLDALPSGPDVPRPRQLATFPVPHGLSRYKRYGCRC